MEASNFILFATASLILNLTPGSDMLYVATRSTTQGIGAGVISSLGIAAGCVVHVSAAVLGLSAILSASTIAFSVVKYLGAAYLIFLGVRTFFAKNNFVADTKSSLESYRKIFWQGAWTNVLNPKVALFFLAFLPQFVQPDDPRAATYILLLGLWFTLSGTVVNTLVALLFGRMGNWLSNRPWFSIWQNKISGIMLFLLGLKIALTKK
jgi:threonine/homoserine/homoserine lactone efflux protein